MADWITAIAAGLTAVFTGLYCWFFWQRGLPLYYLIIDRVHASRVAATLRISNPSATELFITEIAIYRPKGLLVGIPKRAQLPDGMGGFIEGDDITAFGENISYSLVVAPGGLALINHG